MEKDEDKEFSFGKVIVGVLGLVFVVALISYIVFFRGKTNNDTNVTADVETQQTADTQNTSFNVEDIVGARESDKFANPDYDMTEQQTTIPNADVNAMILQPVNVSASVYPSVQAGVEAVVIYITYDNVGNTDADYRAMPKMFINDIEGERCIKDHDTILKKHEGIGVYRFMIPADTVSKESIHVVYGSADVVVSDDAEAGYMDSAIVEFRKTDVPDEEIAKCVGVLARHSLVYAVKGTSEGSRYNEVVISEDEGGKYIVGDVSFEIVDNKVIVHGSVQNNLGVPSSDVSGVFVVLAAYDNSGQMVTSYNNTPLLFSTRSDHQLAGGENWEFTTESVIPDGLDASSIYSVKVVSVTGF